MHDLIILKNSHDVTIGVEFGARIVDVDNTKMKLQIVHNFQVVLKVKY